MYIAPELADAYRHGREYIETNGWWKGGLLGPNRRQVCLVGGLIGGLGLPVNQEGERNPTVVRAARALDLLLPENEPLRPSHPLNRVEWWNDHEATKQEVLDLLAKAEKIALAGFDPDAGIIENGENDE